MLDLGWQEFFLIATIAVVVVGPKDLPKVIRGVMGWVRKIRSMARDFQSSIEEVAREAELDDIRQEAKKLAGQDVSQTILDTVDPDRDLSNTLKETRAAAEDNNMAGGQSMASIYSQPAPVFPKSPDIGSDGSPAEEDGIKGWDASSVSTPSNSIMPPAPPESSKPAPIPPPAKKPRARKAKAAPKLKSKTATAPAGETKSKTAAARKPHKPRAAKPKTPAVTPATEV
jgi:sec-independent protein translocase protein TatB